MVKRYIGNLLFQFYRLLAATVFLSANSQTGMARPVALELFTTGSSSCTNCQYSENAILQLRQAYSNDDLHIIVYHINDDLETFTGVLRRIQYDVNEKHLPVVFFNGTARIEGANKTIFHAYQKKIDDILQYPSRADIQSWMELSSGTLVTEATFQIPIGRSGYAAGIVKPR